MMPDKRDECGCHRECTMTLHACEKPCRWPECLTDAESAELVASIDWDAAHVEVDPPWTGNCEKKEHRPPQGPNEDIGVCTCGRMSFEMRPEGETYGWHLDDCSLLIRHEGRCEPGGEGHPPAPVIRGYWP